MQDIPVTRDPFPHAVIDGWWDEFLLRRVLAEFPDPYDPAWLYYSNSQERKLEGPPAMWGQSTRELFALIGEQAKDLGAAFGIDGLTMETVGGGYHCIEPGGYLAVHTDFNRSPDTGHYRRLNFLIYLNDDWDDPGGHLELWSETERAADIAPELNRTVVFETSDHSWHGHPTPASRYRRSVAAYFFTEEPPPGYVEDHSTIWLADA